MAVLAATVVTLAACVICVIGLAIPYWVTFELTLPLIGKIERNIGLWQACGGGDDDCVEWSSVPSWLKAVRAMEVLGFLVSGAAVLLGILNLLCFKEKSIVAKLAGVLALVAGALMIIGIAIFAAKKKEDQFLSGTDLHAGFALCIISALASFVGGVLFLISK